MEKQTRPSGHGDDGRSSADRTARGSGDTDGRSVALSRPCGTVCGVLPGDCAPLAFPYVPIQDPDPVRYGHAQALRSGTLFPGLDLPFAAAIQERTDLSDTARVELMAIDFAIQELGLYLTTHPGDQEVLQLYWSYIRLAEQGREAYRERYGPLMETDLTPGDGFVWLNDPWPWDVGGND